MNEMLNQRLFDVDEILIRKFNQVAVTLGAKHILTLGEPNYDTPDEIKASGIKAIQDGKTSYGTSYGNQDFRKEIQVFEKRVNKVDYDLSEIMITVGSTEGLTAALLAMLNPGDEVINLTPAYPLYKNVVTLAGGKIVPVDLSKNNFQISPDLLDAAITEKTKAIILTSPNNPTGTLLTDASLEVVYQAVKKHKFFVISDEVYNQIVYDERRLGFSKYQDIRDYIIVCQSLSKPYAMTGWRLGYMLAPLWFMKEVMKIHQYMVVAVNTFIQDAGITALRFDLTSMVESYRERRDYVVDRLSKMGLEFPSPDGAFYVFPSIEKYGINSWEFCEQLVRAEGVALVPGICFDADQHIRVSYCVDLDTIKAGMDGLERFIATL
jgi:aspartate/methionine/tyrosine aminotransferase